MFDLGRKRIQGLWFAALLGLLLSCMGASWLLQAQAHYGFSLWYEIYDIRSHIDQFGPQNRFIAGLETLDKTEHVRLFNDISRAVHQHGEGLKDIRFDWLGRSQPLLHRAEVVHLQDVANLIDIFRTAVWVVTWLTLGLFWWLLRQGSRPQWRMQVLWLAGLILTTLVLVFAIGPKAIFYQLHVWIFPEGNQWFFYYQESLMSTLMKAPYLFGGIGASIAAGGLLLFVLLLWLLRRWPAQQPLSR